jgi:hypothetical protein
MYSKRKSVSQCWQGLSERLYRYRTMPQIIRMYRQRFRLAEREKRQNVVLVHCTLIANTDNEIEKLAADT